MPGPLVGASAGSPNLISMRKSVWQAARATFQLAKAAVLAFGSIIFITVLLITATATLVVVGAGLLPETVPLIRRIAGAKRRQVAGWTGREIPEAYQPITARSASACARRPATPAPTPTCSEWSPTTATAGSRA
jgi:hypothetical protein